MPLIKIHLLSRAHGDAVERVFTEGRIVVGRRPDCDVVIDPSHTLTSGRHLVLQFEDGTLQVHDLDSTNGTQINGATLKGQAPLGPRDRVMLGPDGPILTAEVVRTAAQGTATLAAGENQRTDTVAIPLEETRRYAIEPGAREESSHGSQRSSVGLETMTRMVKATVKRERRRGYALAVAAVALGAVGWHFLGPSSSDPSQVDASGTEGGAAPIAETGSMPEPVPTGEPPTPSMEVAPPGFETVIDSVSQSVYVLVKLTEREGDANRIIPRHSGTAWSIEEGLLGTNGHVAAQFASLKPGETLVARSNTSPTVDLRIVGVRLHPGYRGFASLLTRIRPYDKTSAEVLDLPPAYDVALLEIHPDDVPSQAPPLTLASETVAYDLKAGQPIAFVGFPGEGLVRGGTDLTRPSAKTAIGSLNRVIDPFFGRPEDVSLGHSLEYNIEVVGGASGSPIINMDGEVIGLINAGDVLSQTGYGRVGTGGTSYGPRVDLIRALLRGDGAAEWKHLRPGVTARMLEIFRDGSLEAEEHAGQIGKPLLRTVAEAIDQTVKGEFRITYKNRVSLTEPGMDGRVTLEVPVGEAGVRAIITIAEGSPMGIRVEGRGRADRDRLHERIEGEHVASTVDIRLVATSVDREVLKLDFRAEDDEFFAPGEMSVYVLRLD